MGPPIITYSDRARAALVAIKYEMYAYWHFLIAHRRTTFVFYTLYCAPLTPRFLNCHCWYSITPTSLIRAS